MKLLKNIIKDSQLNSNENWVTSVYWTNTRVYIIKFQKNNHKITIDECLNISINSSKDDIEPFLSALKKINTKLFTNSKVVLTLPASTTTIQSLSLPKLSQINQYIALERQLNKNKEFIWDYEETESFDLLSLWKF